MIYTPYAYKLKLRIDNKIQFYIGVSYEEGSNPTALRKGIIPNVDVINKAVKNGATLEGHTIVSKFEGSENGIGAAFKYTSDLLKFLNVADDDNYINKCNYLRPTASKMPQSYEVHRKVKISPDNSFVLIATYPNGKIKSVKFNGKGATKDCVKYGIGGHIIAQMRRGETVTINRRLTTTRHPFPTGTKLQIK